MSRIILEDRIEVVPPIPAVDSQPVLTHTPRTPE
jgi:hypothetical protein